MTRRLRFDDLVIDEAFNVGDVGTMYLAPPTRWVQPV